MRDKTYEDGITDAVSTLLGIAEYYNVEAEYFISLRAKRHKVTGERYASRAAEVASAARTILKVCRSDSEELAGAAREANLAYERAFSLLLSMP